MFKNYDETRECKKCKNSSTILKNDICLLCDGFLNIGKSILENKKYFVIQNEVNEKSAIFPTINGETVAGFFTNELNLDSTSKNYCINHYNQYQAGNIKVSSFSTEKELKHFAENSKGIKKIGALKIDVDNLESCFLSAFDDFTDVKRKDYKTVARFATYQRTIDMFFKTYVREIAANGKFKLNNQIYEHNYNFLSIEDNRNLQIIYSSGDEAFIIGEWNEVLLVAISINDIFKKFTSEKLTLSASFSIYNHSYPIYNIANEINELEKKAKLNGKNSIALFNDKNVYKWYEFEKVLLTINQLNTTCYYKIENKNNQRNKNKIFFGMNAIHNLYKLLILNEDIAIAKIAYMLGRIKADNKSNDKSEKYDEFTKLIYEKSLDLKSKKHLSTALMIIMYLNRE